MKITKLWQGTMDDLTFKIALFQNGDCFVIDEGAATIIYNDLTTKTWWRETPSGAHYTALTKTNLQPIAPNRPMLLQAWDIGHRFETDNRRAEAITLLTTEIKR
jgi:hypothetical protein